MFTRISFYISILIFFTPNTLLQAKSTDFAQELRKAAAMGNYETVELLLSGGVHPDALCGNPETGELDNVTALTAVIVGGNGYEPHDQESREDQHNRLMIVELLLDKGANPSHVDQAGSTALHWAAIRGYADVMAALIERGNINIDLRGETLFGPTVLFWAIQGGSFQAVRTLLGAGAQVNVCDRDGNTPLHHAVLCGQNEMVALLIERGANPTATNVAGLTPLHLAIFHNRTEIRHYLRVNHPESLGNLTYDMVCNYPQIAYYLINWGQTGDQPDQNGRTVLSYIAERGGTDVARALIKRGAQVNTRDAIGLTPLHYARRNGHNRIVAALLDAGAEDIPAINMPMPTPVLVDPTNQLLRASWRLSNTAGGDTETSGR